MKINKLELSQIVASSISLSELLKNPELVYVDHTQNVSDRLQHWCEVVAAGDWEKFQLRLQWDGLDIATVQQCLAPVDIVNDLTLPDWALTLQTLMETVAEFTTVEQSINSPLQPSHPQPFEDLLLPLILFARQQLLTQLGNHSPLELLSPAAYQNLEYSLLQRLSYISAKALQIEFVRFRPIANSLLSNIDISQKDKPSQVYYHQFVKNLLQDGLLSFCQKYPVLARLIVTVIDFWVEATAEFLQRLQADLPELISLMDKQPEQSTLPQIMELQPGISDAHNRGRSVISVTLASGTKLIYKPKPQGLELAFNHLLEWCNQQELSLHFQVLNILSREKYGWVEYIEQKPCEDEAAAARFYERAGMLLCLTHILRATDFHYENLIASGEHLMLIDMETLLHHEVNPLGEFTQPLSDRTTINQHLSDSVLRIGMLPCWEFSSDGRISYDISGLGSVDVQPAPVRVPRWQAINTDNMYLGYENVSLPLQANIATLNGVALSPNDYLEQLVAGFQQMYRLLMQHQQTLLAVDSPLNAFLNQPVRFVFRATKIYGAILRGSLSPELLRNGIDRSIELDILSRAFLVTSEKPHAWHLLAAEIQSLEQLDIPYFTAFSNSNILSNGLNTDIKHYIKLPSFDRVISYIQKLSESDLAQQISIIQGAFYARVARGSGELEQLPESTTVRDISQLNILTSQELVLQATSLAQVIEKQAISGDDESIKTWIGLGYVADAKRYQLQPIDDSFYNGSCGVAVFLAALDHINGNHQFRDLALAALRSTSQFIATANPKSVHNFAQEVGLGGARGLGSIIYSLVKIHQFLQEATLLQNAKQIAQLITPELIAGDTYLDIISGAAGAILGLLALAEVTQDATILDKAIACGQHLLKHQITVNDNIKAWKTLGNQPLTGFSHGAAGIAYALLRLYAATQNIDFLKAAVEGIAYERSVFSKTAGNWPDFRGGQQPDNLMFLAVNWCHGAPGIGLARLGGWEILAPDEIKQDIEVALHTTQKYSLQDIDHLCCGNFGRIELLLVAAQKLQLPHLEKVAQQNAAWLVARAEKTGGFQLISGLPNHVFSPGFFQGTAGIGYQLLRLAYPERLPSLLLWE